LTVTHTLPFSPRACSGRPFSARQSTGVPARGEARGAERELLAASDPRQDEAHLHGVAVGLAVAHQEHLLVDAALGRSDPGVAAVEHRLVAAQVRRPGHRHALGLVGGDRGGGAQIGDLARRHHVQRLAVRAVRGERQEAHVDAHLLDVHGDLGCHPLRTLEILDRRGLVDVAPVGAAAPAELVQRDDRGRGDAALEAPEQGVGTGRVALDTVRDQGRHRALVLERDDRAADRGVDAVGAEGAAELQAADQAAAGAVERDGEAGDPVAAGERLEALGRVVVDRAGRLHPAGEAEHAAALDDAEIHAAGLGRGRLARLGRALANGRLLRGAQLRRERVHLGGEGGSGDDGESEDRREQAGIHGHGGTLSVRPDGLLIVSPRWRKRFTAVSRSHPIRTPTSVPAITLPPHCGTLRHITDRSSSWMP
jgi:hypothetical protein